MRCFHAQTRIIIQRCPFSARGNRAIRVNCCEHAVHHSCLDGSRRIGKTLSDAVDHAYAEAQIILHVGGCVGQLGTQPFGIEGTHGKMLSQREVDSAADLQRQAIAFLCDRWLQIIMLEGRRHAVDLVLRQVVACGFVAPLGDDRAEFPCDGASPLFVQLEIWRDFQSKSERSRVVVLVDCGTENARLDVGRHRIEVVGRREAPALPAMGMRRRRRASLI